MSLLDDAFWEALDAAQGDEDAAFPILKRKLANPPPSSHPRTPVAPQ